jgi:DNA-binding MarR family transcriptional regulator
MPELWLKIEEGAVTEVKLDGISAALKKPVESTEIPFFLEAVGFLQRCGFGFKVPENSKAEVQDPGAEVPTTPKERHSGEDEKKPSAFFCIPHDEREKKILTILEGGEKLGAKEIAEKLGGISSRGLSKILRSMYEKGLILREIEEEKGRPSRYIYFIPTELREENLREAIIAVFKESGRNRLKARQIAKRLEKRGISISIPKLRVVLKDLADEGILDVEKQSRPRYYSSTTQQPEKVASESPWAAPPKVEEEKVELSSEEETTLQEIYDKGQVWDDEISRETRKLYRQLEDKGLLRASVTTWDEGKKKFRRAFWTLTEKGIAALGG